MAIGLPEDKQLPLFETRVTPLMQEAGELFRDIGYLLDAAEALRSRLKPVNSLLPRIQQLLPRLAALGFARDEASLRTEWRASIRAEQRRPGDFGDGEIPFESFACDTLGADMERLRKLAEGDAETFNEADALVEAEITSLHDALQRLLAKKPR